MEEKKNSQENQTANHKASAFSLFKKLIPMPEIRDLLINKLSVYLGDFLKPDISSPLLWKMHDEIIDEVDATFKLDKALHKSSKPIKPIEVSIKATKGLKHPKEPSSP